MANFPTSVFSPASRTNGQTIDQSWFNGLQDEVTAIEDGFRNATAPLNSSRSTLVSLNVTGGSTLASLSVTGGSTFGAMTLGASTLASLSVTGNSTLAALKAGASILDSLNVTGNSTVGGLSAAASTVATLSVSGGSTFAVRPIMPLPDVAILTLTNVQNITNNTTSAMIWSTQTTLTNSSLHSTTTNPTRLTPQSTGVYAISANIALSASLNQSTSELNARLEDSSGTLLGQGQLIGDTDNDATVHVAALKRFDVTGSWARIVVIVRDGSTASVKAGAPTGFFLHKLL